jgi:2,4-dienoyl-CoA reductase-like NADH-dependent reductase (Old Yellow Enzyme family)
LLNRISISRALIAHVNMTADRGNRLITEEFADMIAFPWPYIANPDLVERLADLLPQPPARGDRLGGVPATRPPVPGG